MLGRWTQAFSAEAELQVQTYYDYSRRDVPRQFQEQRSTYDFEVQHRFLAAERHAVVVGGGYRTSLDHTAQEERTFVFSPFSRRLGMTRFFAQDKIAWVAGQLELTVGALAERNVYSGWETQPTVRLAWTPEPRQFVWVGISRAVRVPTRADADTQFRPDPTRSFVLIAVTRSCTPW